MPNAAGRSTRPPLDPESLEQLALGYVGRFATSRARLVAYLGRKVAERGWSGPGEPPLEAVAERLGERGYVDDGEYALGRARTLLGRGYGRGRIEASIRAAGIAEDQSGAARELIGQEEAEAALRFARRKRLGPFARQAPAGPREQQRAIAALVRAGHGFAVARAIVACRPGESLEASDLKD